MSSLKTKNFKKAFSLVELIFVISILGIIAALAIPKLLDSRSNAIVSTIKQDISTISNAIQSHYMINNGIEKITDSVNINPKTWEITDKKLEYKDNEAICLIIEVVNNKLNITIDESSGDICKKLYDSGIRTITYELF